MGHVRLTGRIIGSLIRCLPDRFTGPPGIPVDFGGALGRSACFTLLWRCRPALLDCACLLPCCRLLLAPTACARCCISCSHLLHALVRRLRRYALPLASLAALASSALIRSRNLSRLRSSAALLFHSACSTAGNALVYKPGFNSDFDTPDFAVMMT